MISKEEFIYQIDSVPAAIPKLSECETCVYGTPFFCPQAKLMREHYLYYDPEKPVLVDILKAGILEIVEPANDCPSYIEDPKFKDRNMD